MGQASLNLLTHFQEVNTPFILKYGQSPQWEDSDKHQAAYRDYPRLYALLALVDSVLANQRVKILFQILQASRLGMSDDLRLILDRVVRFLFKVLEADQVLKVFLALRRVRANHKHTTRAIASYILNHPELPDLYNSRRPTVIDCLEHALGQNVARACLKFLPEIDEHQPYVRKHLLRYAHDTQSAVTVLSGRNEEARTGDYNLIHTVYTDDILAQSERPKTVTATNRGEISANLVHIYRGGASIQLQKAVTESVEESSSKLPMFAGKLALVFDASSSTRSYGEREYCALAQSVALRNVLQKVCSNLEVISVGGTGEFPTPQGTTDLAMGLVDALATNPDLVAIVSDGYENVWGGDLARVVATLPKIGREVPVVFCHSTFTNSDDLSLRVPAPNLPQLSFWHQNDFEELLLSLFIRADDGLGERSVEQFLLVQLYRREQEFNKS